MISNTVVDMMLYYHCWI